MPYKPFIQFYNECYNWITSFPPTPPPLDMAPYRAYPPSLPGLPPPPSPSPFPHCYTPHVSLSLSHLNIHTVAHTPPRLHTYTSYTHSIPRSLPIFIFIPKPPLEGPLSAFLSPPLFKSLSETGLDGPVGQDW